MFQTCCKGKGFFIISKQIEEKNKINMNNRKKISP
ncbi:hypothetical protein BACUNI_01681 [Bacteroides uniformis ATCC 8492]|uniref:Uncharacterized protein n=1 Tax=Bacteroides uniformis (strain ATCC 8492 / DSM 6597 / CCUG 4942 / CIP 103695 / JCM 5828 / KCTC 5204 / NCTC 13054 / VPI 0061) TaxID=411479 RepID=A0ABC9ND86_BACUC|nr:hypothetical protein BACUNI_01681 [Bacteroides uniformis ATCC 8492]